MRTVHQLHDGPRALRAQGNLGSQGSLSTSWPVHSPPGAPGWGLWTEVTWPRVFPSTVEPGLALLGGPVSSQNQVGLPVLGALALIIATVTVPGLPGILSLTLPGKPTHNYTRHAHEAQGWGLLAKDCRWRGRRLTASAVGLRLMPSHTCYQVGLTQAVQWGEAPRWPVWPQAPAFSSLQGHVFHLLST